MSSERFETLVESLTARLQPIPIVSPEQYRAISCNRCGLCCEDIRASEPPEAIGARSVDPAYDDDRRRFYAGLELVEQVGREWRYRCRHFARDEQGLGLCTIHSTRPNICREYPYGLVVRQWRECAWYVDVRDEDGDIVPVVSPLATPSSATSVI